MLLLIEECKAYIQFEEKKAIKDMTIEEIAGIVRYLVPIVMDFAGCINTEDIAKVTNEIKRVNE